LDLNVLREATAFPLEPVMVTECLNLEEAADCLFAEAWKNSLSTLPVAQRRGALSGVTGHVAESVIELVFDELGYHVVWHFAGPGRHGVDLIFLSPVGDQLLAVEVKGTLRANHWPRLSRRELTQMSVAWVDKADNPGMVNWNLNGSEIYGGVVLVNFAEMSYRARLTSDFVYLRPGYNSDQLADLSWLDST
jgi:hypothetical protein